MYVYTGELSYGSYIQNNWFFLVVKSRFRVGAGIRAFWQWTTDEDGNENQNQVLDGIINSEVINSSDSNTRFGVLYDADYSFDLSVSEDEKSIAATMYRRMDSDGEELATFSLTLKYSAREASADYDPAKALPKLRLYDVEYWKMNLFTMIVPGNLCHGAPIWYSAQENYTLYSSSDNMQVLGQDDTTITVSFNIGPYTAQIKLNRDDSGWQCVGGSITNSIKLPDSHHQLPVTQRNILGPLHDTASLSESLLNRSATELELRTNSKVKNDTRETVLCTLSESGTSVKGKVLAGVGMGLAGVGMLPLGGFSLPVAIIGALFATVGLYDALNDEDGPVQTLMFPNDEMSRITSGGIPIGDNNDLSIIHIRIESNLLSFRVGVKERIGSGTTKLSSVLSDSSLFNSLIDITWSQHSRQILQACKFVKFSYLKPQYGTSKKLASLSDESVYNMSAGQMITNTQGSQYLWDTLNTSPSKNDITFTFSSEKVDTVLIHAYEESSSRSYDIITLPESKLMVLRLRKCTISLGDAYSSRLSGPVPSEGDAQRKIVENGGYDAYSWRSNERPFGYRLQDLVDQEAGITFTQNSLDYVFIPIAGWLPWQRMVSQ